MALTFVWSDPGDIETPTTTVDLGTEVVRFGTMTLTQSADVGEPSVSGISIDDPGAIYDFVGLRTFQVRETSAPSNNQIVWRGVIQDRHVQRMDSMRTGAARRWTLDLVDYNWVLSKRVLVDADSNRPDETAGDRLRWLLASAAHFNMNDYGNVHYPSDQMEANDYRGQRPSDVLADCAVESGYTFWAEYNEAHRQPELFFINPNGTDLPSTLRISNDYSDYDGTTTFVPYEDATLDRSAARVAYGVYLPYTNGSVYVRKDITGQQFAKIDQTAPMANVKREARARRIANHFLNDNDEEDDTVTCAIKVPAAQVNDIRAGRYLDCKFTHLPGYDAFRPMRVKHRTVIQDEEGGGHRGFVNTEAYYRIELELSPTNPGASCSVAIAAAETLELNHQPYPGSGSVSQAFNFSDSNGRLIIAAVIVRDGNMNMVAGSGWTSINADDAPAGHPSWVVERRSVTTSSTNITATWTPGFNPPDIEVWAMAAVAFPTSASSIVQEAGPSVGAPQLPVSFPSALTPGNLLCCVMIFRSDSNPASLPPNDPFYVGNGWTTLARAYVTTFDGVPPDPDLIDSIYIMSKCIEAGDSYQNLPAPTFDPYLEGLNYLFELSV